MILKKIPKFVPSLTTTHTIKISDKTTYINTIRYEREQLFL